MSLAFGQLTFLKGRKDDVNYRLDILAFDKTTLTREMSKISFNYQQALSSKVMKLSGNNGATYTDISYNILMKPNTANGNKPMMLADTVGKTVLNGKYKDYAERISPNGEAGGNWSGDNRLEILESLTGISKNKISQGEEVSKEAKAAKKVWDIAVAKRNTIKDKAKTMTAEQFISKYCKTSFSGNVTQSNASSIVSTLDSAINSGYLPTSVTEGFSKYAAGYAQGVKDEDSMSASEFAEDLLSSYLTNELGSSTLTVYTDGNKSILADYEAASQACKDAEQAYKDVLGDDASLLTATEERSIAFYDQIFTAIADNGWTYDAQIEDNDYLNQTLQNGTYCFVNMTKDDTNSEDSSKYGYDYEFEVASNNPNIFTVNNSHASDIALAEYETQKTLINEKEQRIDKKMNNLKLERDAIIKMIESCEQMGKDNFDRTLKIFA